MHLQEAVREAVLYTANGRHRSRWGKIGLPGGLKVAIYEINF